MSKKVIDKFELSPDKLRWQCNVDAFKCESTETAKPLDGILGQKRAITAIEDGLDMDSPGYNIFVSGVSGSGKMSTIKAMLKKQKKNNKHALNDIIYVNNFKEPRKPHCIKIPAGQAKDLKREMKDVIDTLQKVIPNLFEHEDYKDARNKIIETYREKQKNIFKNLENDIKKENFTMVQVQMGPYTRPMILPLIENQPVQFDQLESLAENGNFPQKTLERLKEKHQVLYNDLEKAMKAARVIEKELKDKLDEVEKLYGMSVIEGLIKDIREKFANDKISAYLDEVQESVLDNLSLFKEEEASPPAAAPQMPNQKIYQNPERMDDDKYFEYRVNIVVDNSETRGVPIVIENTPNYKNLFGTIEKTWRSSGQVTTDFNKITAGSFLRSDGGYLVINLLDAVTEPGVWKTLKRTLKNRQLEIESYDSMFFFMSSAMKPEPVDINVKIIASGDDELFSILHMWDDDFKKVFKIKADFDYVVENSKEFISKYSSFVHKIVTDEGLKHFEKSAVAAIVEEGVRMAGNQKKLTARFSKIADIIREASLHANRGKSKLVKSAHVYKAIEARRYRSSLYEEKVGEMLKDGKLMVSTSGSVVGQINGLAVYQIGDFAFGKPSRITAQASMGRAGIINIEREAKLSGKIHDKGMLILAGYLRGKFAQDKPLSLSVSICFEQNYGGIDGDSATAAEIFVLMSELSGLPLKQNIACTGSVNQKGEIQPIGGVNHKIEGFFKTCKDQRLTGNQGVIIPHQNVDDLMLDAEVVSACEKGKFHIYSIADVDEGIEILTGKPAGKLQSNGKYPEGTINYLADQRLRKLALDLRDFRKDNGDDEDEKEPAKKKAIKKKRTKK